jgi:UDP-N-acetylmuramoyl-L-alanyl-D-glutamate--2,6-diaminopimelate ligase
MLNQIKKFIPRFALSYYHQSLAILAKLVYGSPSEKLIVIGVTGTNGKTSTCSFIAEDSGGSGIQSRRGLHRYF